MRDSLVDQLGRMRPLGPGCVAGADHRVGRLQAQQVGSRRALVRCDRWLPGRQVDCVDTGGADVSVTRCSSGLLDCGAETHAALSGDEEPAGTDGARRPRVDQSLSRTATCHAVGAVGHQSSCGTRAGLLGSSRTRQVLSSRTTTLGEIGGQRGGVCLSGAPRACPAQSRVDGLPPWRCRRAGRRREGPGRTVFRGRGRQTVARSTFGRKRRATRSTVGLSSGSSSAAFVTQGAPRQAGSVPR